MNKYTDEQLDREVAFLLLRHRGKANAINRWDMVEHLFGVGTSYPRNDSNYPDRRIRTKEAAQAWGEKHGYSVVFFWPQRQRVYADRIAEVAEQAAALEAQSVELVKFAEGQA